MKKKPQIRVFYNNEHQLNYLAIPKTGTSTIKIHYRMGEYWAEPGKQPDYPILCTVRDIFDRFLSGYDQMVKSNMHFGTLDEFIDKTENWPYWNTHITPQTYFLEAVKPDILVNTNDISKFLGTNVIKNPATRPKPTLTEEQKARVMNIYQEDWYFIKGIDPLHGDLLALKSNYI